MKQLIVAALALLAATPCFAHAILEGGPVVLDEATELSVRIDHGCDGAATDTVIVGLPPAGITSIQPMVKPGWTIEIVGDGEVATGISWSGGSLPGWLYDRFTFRVVLGGIPSGEALAFPVTQRCGDTEIAWSELAAAGVDPDGLANPAPTVMILAAGVDGEAAAFSFSGALSVTEAWARATPPGAGVGGVYGIIANGSDDEILITGGSSPLAEEIELHSMSVENNVMRMAEVEGGLAIPAGGTIAFEPGGYHIMLQGLLAPLVEGTTIPVTLTFSDGTSIDLTVPVLGLGAQGPAPKGEHQH